MTSDNPPLPPAGPRTCPVCHDVFEPKFRNQGFCERCSPGVAEQREQTWLDFCPPLYRKSDLSRLPVAAVEAAEKYEYGPEGLALVGKSGIGKTRAMMVLCRRLIFNEGRHGHFVPAAVFSREIASHGHEAGQYTAKLRRTGVLFIDDLGKGKLTDAVQAHLFDILEERTANLRPTLWTSNAGGKALAAMFSKDRADPFLRRLTEFSKIIKL